VGSFSGIVQTGQEAGIRLDRYASEYLKLLSRSQMKSRSVTAKLNGKAVKFSKPVRPGDVLELRWEDEIPETLEPEDIPLDILYEDDRTVVVNKAAGMVVHPGAGNHSGTLANALLFRRLQKNITPDPPCFGIVWQNVPALRTGIVHRLDKDTSGVIIAAYDDKALAFLASQFKAGKTKKHYAALVSGTPANAEGIITGSLVRDPRDRKRFAVSAVPGKGKASLTRYRVIRSWGLCSLVLVRPKTGRTHQIRVHLRSIGHPVAGDPVYGYKDLPFLRKGLMLHAYSLEITLPDHDFPSRFKAPLPPSFRENIRILKRHFP
jgi:23S rRNA pseudouridine1911/1915/1917 synthase